MLGLAGGILKLALHAYFGEARKRYNLSHLILTADIIDLSRLSSVEILRGTFHWVEVDSYA